MPKIQIPIAKGLGKDFKTADYIDVLPVNMLATPKEILNAAGYLRSFPGIEKKQEVNGISRGVQFNTKNNTLYRVCGNKLYLNNEEIADIAGNDRVSLSHSINSQAVCFDGQLTFHNYDGEEKELSNWPEEEIVQEGYTREIKKWQHKSGNDDFITLTKDDIDGLLSLKIIPKSSDGKKGNELTISESQFGSRVSQSNPGGSKPYLTDILVDGIKRIGGKITITYKMNGSTTDSTEFAMIQTVPEVIERYPQYNLGEIIDVCHNRSRYIFLQKGGNRFGVTDLEDESKPDRYRPFYSAESQPDGIISVASWRDMIVCFGSSTIEYFSLTGSSDASQPIYIAQPAYMIQIGIAGRDCKCRYQDNYAIISHHSIDQPSIYIIGSGEKNKISTATIDKIMSNYSADELSKSVMESIKFDNHELLIIHLPKHTLCFDISANNQWSILKSGLYDDPYRAIDFMFFGNQITVGDKKEGVIGHLVFNASNQYEHTTEHLLYTPMIKVDNSRLFDFELEASTGVAQIADKLFLSATTDGINYGREQLIEQNSPFRYDQRVIWQRVGRVRKNIGFKIRIITKSPVTLSDLSLRIE